MLELRREARQGDEALLQGVQGAVPSGVAQEACAGGGDVKWVPDWSESPKNGVDDARWVLKRVRPNSPKAFSITDPVALVRKQSASPLLGVMAVYAAEVVKPGRSLFDGGRSVDIFRPAAELFTSLKDAQLWCEAEVKMMEVGELA